MDKKEIIKELNKTLDAKRFAHTVGVAHTAACLAMSEGIDHEKAFMAGLLHDCAKYMSNKEFIDHCESNGIEISNVERENPALLHSKVGEHLAAVKYNVTDPEIGSAIRWHTTGHPDMSTLDAVVFTADYIEPNRTHDPDLMIIRKEAFDNLDKAIYHIYENTMKHLKSSAKTLDPMTEESYKFYKDKLKRE